MQTASVLAAAAAAVCATFATPLPLSSATSLSSLSALHGLSPTLQRTLATAFSFTCDSSTKRFDVVRINDNYCDCADGSDEPGTSACSHTPAVFHCANAGFYAQDIPTSRVNDGLCDCCDGSDEYASTAACASTCTAQMQTFQTEKAVEIAAMEAGENDRNALVAASNAAIAADEATRAELTASIANARVMLEQQTALKNHEEHLEEQERVVLLQTTKQSVLEQLGLVDLSPEQLGVIVVDMLQFVDKPDELLALIQRARDEVVSDGHASPSPLDVAEAAFQVRDAERQHETERIQALRTERQHVRDEQQRKRDEAAAAAVEDNEEDTPGVGAGSTPSTVENVENVDNDDNDDELQLPAVETRPSIALFAELRALNDHTRSEAVDARATLAATTSTLAKDESALQTLEAKLAQAYGPDKVLYGLRDVCYETQSGEYLYSICVFGQAKQSSTRLGSMQELATATTGTGTDGTDSNDTSVKELVFTGGDKCWNGPERSMTVTLECGASPAELFAVDEPATCVYTARLRTPAACDARNRERVLSPTSGDDRIAPHFVEVEVDATL